MFFCFCVGSVEAKARKQTEMRVDYFSTYVSSWDGSVRTSATLIIPGPATAEYSVASNPANGAGVSVYYSYYSEYSKGCVISVYLNDTPNVTLRIRIISKKGRVTNKSPLLINPQDTGGSGVEQERNGDIYIWGPTTSPSGSGGSGGGDPEPTEEKG